MGLKDFFGGILGKKDSDAGKPSDESKEEKSEEEAKYEEETCALCGGKGADKKWAGQYWHKKCMRQAKKGARKMI